MINITTFSVFVFSFVLFLFLKPSFSEEASFECSTCELVVNGIVEVLESNKTGTTLEEAIEEVCDLLGFKKEECDEIGETLKSWGPKLEWALNREDLTPKAICALGDVCYWECCSSNKPEQVHLALTGDLTEMSVTWVTLELNDAIVQYGLSSTSLTMNQTGYSYTYTNGGWKGYIHHTVLKNLQGDTKYYYRVGSVQTGLYSQVFSFTTFTQGNYSNRALNFAVIGDAGADEVSDNTMSRISEVLDKLDYVIHVGDISYADGVQDRWDEYLRKVEPITANVPYMVNPGNHEIGVVGLLNITAYKWRFNMPGNTENLFYSYDYGNVHFIACDSEDDLDMAYLSNEQLQWIENDLKLANENRKERPWIIMTFHRPLYCSSTRTSDCGEPNAVLLRSLLEDMLAKYQVDLVIVGHIHYYERLNIVYKGVLQSTSYDNPKYPVYLINGAGGNREGTSGVLSNPPDWSAVRIQEWGFLFMSVIDRNTIDIAFHSAKTGEVLDKFVITKDH